jgi:hypothetical protein
MPKDNAMSTGRTALYACGTTLLLLAALSCSHEPGTADIAPEAAPPPVDEPAAAPQSEAAERQTVSLEAVGK